MYARLSQETTREICVDGIPPGKLYDRPGQGNHKSTSINIMQGLMSQVV